MKKVNFKFLSFAAIGLCMAATSCKKDKEGSATQDLPQVNITTVKSQSVGQSETYTATVESDVKNNIAPNSPMRIRKILVEVGDKVGKGQVVALLDATNQNQMEMQIQSQQSSIK